MITYYGTWTANSNTWGKRTDTNKRRLARDLREIVRGNLFAGQSGTWAIARETSNNGLTDLISGRIYT